MFIVLYRWRVKPGFEDQLIKSWSEVTAEILANYGSLGSRLHRGDDGLWYAYAQWRTSDDREAAFGLMKESQSRSKMRTAIEEFLPEIILDPVADYLVHAGI